MRRRWGFVGVVLGAVAVAAVSGLATLRYSRVSDPTPTISPPRLPTVEVRQATVRRTVPIQVRVAAETMDVGHVPERIDGKAIVTSLSVEAGEQVRPGALLLTVADRPVFALPGTTPAFRSLRPKVSGVDVRQLQQGLAALGYEVGDVDGLYGPVTARAVAAFYRDLGFPAAGAGDPKAEDGSGGVQRLSPSEATVPFGELVFVPWEDAVVDAALVSVGDVVSGPMLRLRAAELVGTAQLPADFDLPPGTRVEMADGARAEAPNVETVQAEDGELRLVLTFPIPSPSPDLRVGSVLPARLVLADSGAEVLAVPAAAVAEDGEGLYVEADRHGTEVRIGVEVGVVGDELVEVRPLGGELRPGDRVVAFVGGGDS